MKHFVAAFLTAMTMTSAFAQVIIFEEEVRTTRVTVINGGQIENHGDIQIGRAPRPRANGRLGIGSSVITSDNRAGVVKSMFVAKDIVVVFDSYYGNRQWKLKDIAVTSGCNGPFCAGDTVITSDHRAGVVKGYFSNGDIVVFDSYYGNRTWNQSEIALTNGCDSMFCTGDKVITSDNRSGVVKAFHPNGDLEVFDSYYGNRTWDRQEISITAGVCANIYVNRVRMCHR